MTENNHLFEKSKVNVERTFVCNVTENLLQHGTHCLPCSCTNDVTDLLLTIMSYSCHVMSSSCHSVKVPSNSWLFSSCYGSRSAMVTGLCCHLTYNSRAAWHTVHTGYAMLLLNYK